MRKLVLNGGLILALLFIVPSKGFASEVSVGEQSVKIKDAFARAEDWFGKPALEVYFFTAPLTDVQKEQIAVKRYFRDEDVEAVAGENLPVLHLLLFFKEKAEACSPDDLISYTAVFNKNKSFDFNVSKKTPINWSYQRIPKQPLYKIGIQQLSCSFVEGGQLRLTAKHQWLAQRSMFPDLLPAGKDSLRFAWDVDMVVKVIDPSNKRKRTTNTT